MTMFAFWSPYCSLLVLLLLAPALSPSPSLLS